MLLKTLCYVLMASAQDDDIWSQGDLFGDAYGEDGPFADPIFGAPEGAYDSDLDNFGYDDTNDDMAGWEVWENDNEGDDEGEGATSDPLDELFELPEECNSVADCFAECLPSCFEMQDNINCELECLDEVCIMCFESRDEQIGLQADYAESLYLQKEMECLEIDDSIGRFKDNKAEMQAMLVVCQDELAEASMRSAQFEHDRKDSKQDLRKARSDKTTEQMKLNTMRLADGPTVALIEDHNVDSMLRGYKHEEPIYTHYEVQRIEVNTHPSYMFENEDLGFDPYDKPGLDEDNYDPFAWY